MAWLKIKSVTLVKSYSKIPHVEDTVLTDSKNED